MGQDNLQRRGAARRGGDAGWSNAGRAFGRLAAAAGLAAVTGLATSGAATAQSFGDSVDIYIGVFKDDVKPVVMYVFSDPAQEGLAVIDATAMFPRPDYAPTNQFDANEACLSTFDFDLESIPDNGTLKISDKPIYGPGSTQRTIDPFSLPSYMAREASKLLLTQGLTPSEDAATPYFNCAGFVWSQILYQPDGFWQETYRQLIEEKKQGQ